jgi:hypothetical protein
MGRLEAAGAEEKRVYYLTGDATIEAAGELLRDNPRGLLLARDELDGWFQSFTRHKGKGGGNDRPNWLELFRAGTLRLNRITRPRGALSVRRACLSVCGTIQPPILARALDDEAMAAGLGARFLMAMPPPHRRRWSEAEVEEGLATHYRNLLAFLLGLPLADETKRLPYFVGLDRPAKDVWVDWFNRWGMRKDSSEGEQAAALAKLEGYAARLALVHHVVALAVEGVAEPREVTRSSLEAGIALAEWFADEAIRIYKTLKESDRDRAQRHLVEWIAAHGGRVSVRQLQKANSRRWPSHEAAEEDLEELVRGGLGEWVEGERPANGGHTPRSFQLNNLLSDTSDTRSASPRNSADAERVSEVSDSQTPLREPWADY